MKFSEVKYDVTDEVVVTFKESPIGKLVILDCGSSCVCLSLRDLEEVLDAYNKIDS